jgi:DNA replication protein DnaC
MTAAPNPGRDTGTPQEDQVSATPGPTPATEPARAFGDPVEGIGSAMARLAGHLGMPGEIQASFGTHWAAGRATAATRPPPPIGASIHIETDTERAERQATAQQALRARRERSHDVYGTRMPRRLRRPFPGVVPADVRAWMTDAAGPNLILCSADVGTGKSHLAWQVGLRRSESGAWVVGWSTPDFNDALRPDGDDRAQEEATICDLLVLDELGAEKVSDWTLERLLMVIGGRWAEERPTVITTNLTPDALGDRYGDRIVDRLMDGAVVCEMGGLSHRHGPSNHGS